MDSAIGCITLLVVVVVLYYAARIALGDTQSEMDEEDQEDRK